jgi:hypothetical protein
LSTVYAGRAQALTITGETQCTNPTPGTDDNQLRVTCEVHTDAAAMVWVEFENRDDAGGCEPSSARTSSRGMSFGGGGPAPGPSFPGTAVMYYMQEETDYCWRPAARAGAGLPVYGAWQGNTTPTGAVTTGSLPYELTHMTIDVDGEPINTKNVLLNFACHPGATDKYDWLVVAATDTSLAETAEARVRWYEDPAATVVDRDVAITGLNVAEEEGTILALLDHDYVVEYRGSGKVERLYCRDDPDEAGEQCIDDTAVTPAAYFDPYVHHDVMRSENGHTVVLTAKQGEAPDVLDCDDDPSTTTQPMVVDGVTAWATDDDSLVYDWAVTDWYEPSFEDAGCDPHGNRVTSCDGNDYWTADGLLDGCDWAHTNSVWEDSSENLLLSWKAWDRIVSLGPWYTSSYFYVEGWTINGGGFLGGTTEYDLGSGTFYEQHAALELDSDSLLIYDNDTDPSAPGSNRSRGIHVVLDVSTGTASVLYAYTMQTIAGQVADPQTYVECETGGSVTHVPPAVSGQPDSVLAFCVGHDDDGRDNPDRADDPFFNEFTVAGNLSWTMEVGCDSANGRMGPSYRGYANVFLQ